MNSKDHAHTIFVPSKARPLDLRHPKPTLPSDNPATLSLAIEAEAGAPVTARMADITISMHIPVAALQLVIPVVAERSPHQK